MPKQIRRAAVTNMTRKNNNRTENKNTRSNARKNTEQQQDLFVHVETDTRIETGHKTATELAREKAEAQAKREQEREAAKAAREREQKLAQKFDETCMSVNDALRSVAAHTKDELEEGFTVGDYMAAKGLTKLTVKALREALPTDFVREDGIYMPTTQAAVYEGAPEDERNGKAVYYCVTKGKAGDKRKVWKRAQTYGFSRIALWTPAVVRRLLTAGMTYADKQAHYAKRNAEVKATKHFYVLNERTEKAVSGKKVNQKSVVENYVEVANENVKWAC
jgi:hypothetical protein